MIIQFGKKGFVPIIGTVSDVAGTFSATMSIKTENATKHVKPKVTFSPDDVGSLETIQIPPLTNLPSFSFHLPK